VCEEHALYNCVGPCIGSNHIINLLCHKFSNFAYAYNCLLQCVLFACLLAYLRNEINMIMMTTTTAGMTATNTATAVGAALKLLLLLLHLLLLLLLLIQPLPLLLPYNIIFHRVSLIDASTAGL
jgi:hypothetical protein